MFLLTRCIRAPHRWRQAITEDGMDAERHSASNEASPTRAKTVVTEPDGPRSWPEQADDQVGGLGELHVGIWPLLMPCQCACLWTHYHVSSPGPFDLGLSGTSGASARAQAGTQGAGSGLVAETAAEDDEFLDPITCELIIDPVVCSDGRTYDRC